MHTFVIDPPIHKHSSPTCNDCPPLLLPILYTSHLNIMARSVGIPIGVGITCQRHCLPAAPHECPQVNSAILVMLGLDLLFPLLHPLLLAARNLSALRVVRVSRPDPLSGVAEASSRHRQRYPSRGSVKLDDIESTIHPHRGKNRSILREKSFLFTGGFPHPSVHSREQAIFGSSYMVMSVTGVTHRR